MICRKCSVELRDDTWYPSSKARKDLRCKTCVTAQVLARYHEKRASGAGKVVRLKRPTKPPEVRRAYQQEYYLNVLKPKRESTRKHPKKTPEERREARAEYMRYYYWDVIKPRRKLIEDIPAWLRNRVK